MNKDVVTDANECDVDDEVDTGDYNSSENEETAGVSVSTKENTKVNTKRKAEETLQAFLEKLQEAAVVETKERRFTRDLARNVITFRLNDGDYARVKEMKELIGAKSISEVILQSLATFSAIVSHLQRGRQIQIELNDEDGL